MHKLNLSTVDLNLLTSLEALLEECHVGRTAQRLNISQPTMSRTLSRLRIAFGDELIVRTNLGYVKTPRGEWLEVQIKEPLKAIRDALFKQDFDPEKDSSIFKIAALDYGEVFFVPELLQILKNEAPNIKLEIIYGSLHSAQNIQDFVADIGIGIKPKISTDGVVRELLFEDEMVCVMCKNHPLAKTELTIESYLNYGHSIVRASGNYDSQIDIHLGKQNLSRNILRQSSSFVSAQYSLPNTELLQTTGRFAARLISANGRLVIKDLPFQLPPIGLNLIWHVRNNGDARNMWFRKKIVEISKKFKTKRTN